MWLTIRLYGTPISNTPTRHLGQVFHNFLRRRRRRWVCADAIPQPV